MPFVEGGSGGGAEIWDKWNEKGIRILDWEEESEKGSEMRFRESCVLQRSR